MKLYTKIFIGLLAGIVFGLVAGEYALYVEFLGTIFIRLITMVVVPLVMASLILGTASLGNIKQLGRIGLKTFFILHYYNRYCYNYRFKFGKSVTTGFRIRRSF